MRTQTNRNKLHQSSKAGRQETQELQSSPRNSNSQMCDDNSHKNSIALGKPTSQRIYPKQRTPKIG